MTIFLASEVVHPARFSLMGIEGALTVVAVAASFAWPRLGAPLFTWAESQFVRLARKPVLSVLIVGLAPLLLRLALLPIHPIPMPFAPDDFSNLLAADTFAHGRLSNPTPALWTHFETIHVDMLPTYASMYFPAQGLLMAAGKVLFGQPWFGVLISGALMCAAICWMLQGWLPPSWALLGGFLAAMRIALFSYWTGTYHTAGPICALGGALVLGSLPRFKRALRTRHLFLMATGAGILAISRPYEGLLLCLPVVIVLVRWQMKSRRLSLPTLFARSTPALALLIAALAWLGYYDYRAFGNPLTLPYTINRATYAMAPYYVWQEPRPEPHYRHAEMRRFYQIDELDDYNRNHSVSGFFIMTTVKAIRAVYFFTGIALIPPLFLLPWAIRDRRIRFLALSLIVLAAGMAIEIYLIPHYVAPFTAAFYAVGLQAMRHLYQCTPGGKPVGRAMTHWVIAICVFMTVLRPFNKQLGCAIPEKPVSTWIVSWFGPDHFVTQRSLVEQQLDQNPGGQLAIVRYSPEHDPLDEWVYNAADIDGSRIIWARAMDPASDLELIRHYGQRKAWLIQPDSSSEEIAPYPLPQQVTGVSLH
ncbi:MAG TPA: hypothetical protein VN753_15730 [Terracidiphilus sp.]|nr:hypothetical protein [Terracidiphilus sp.]